MKRFLPFLFLFVVSCATVPAIPAMPQLDALIRSDILSHNHLITAQEKKAINAALVDSKAEIKKAESENKALSFWSFWGKIGAAVIFVFLLICVIKKTLF